MKVTVPRELMKGAAQVTRVINDSNGSADKECSSSDSSD